MGIVDGSDAPPGAVGEYLVISTSQKGGLGGGAPAAHWMTGTGNQTVAALTLSAGDWTVGATVNMSLDWVGGNPPTSPIYDVWMYLGPPQANYDIVDTAPDVAFFGWLNMSAGTAGTPPFNSEFEVSIGPVRINTAVSTQAILMAYVNAVPPVPATAGYTIWARRMR